MKILIIIIIFFTKSLLAYEYTGKVNSLSNSILLKYSPFQGSFNSNWNVDYNIGWALMRSKSNSSGTFEFKNTKYNQNIKRSIIIKYNDAVISTKYKKWKGKKIFDDQYEDYSGAKISFESINSTSGKFIGGVSGEAEYQGQKIPINKDLIKSEISDLDFFNSYGYIFKKSNYKQGDKIIILNWDKLFKSIMPEINLYEKGGIEDTGGQRPIDIIPRNIFGIIEGTSCYKNRSVLVINFSQKDVEFRNDIKSENIKVLSRQSVKGYSLIDISTGLVLESNIELKHLTDFGRQLESGAKANTINMNIHISKGNFSKKINTCNDLLISNKNQINSTNKDKSQSINADSFEERLTNLKSLFDKDLITKEEYDQKRKEILEEL